MSSHSGLLRSRRFAPLFVTQLLGALNDNVLKNAMVVLLTFQAASWTTLKPEILANLAAGIFILPFFLFSATAGQLADKTRRAWPAWSSCWRSASCWSRASASRSPASISCFSACSCWDCIPPCSAR